MKKLVLWLLVIVLLIAGAVLMLYPRFVATPERATPPAEPPPQRPVQPTNEIRYPLPAPEPAAAPEPVAQAPAEEPADEPEPLPPLEASDALLKQALDELADTAGPLSLLRDNLIRRLVVSVDNLPREQVAQRHLPTRPIGGAVRVRGEPEALELSPDNYARYEDYIRVLEALSTQRLVDLYVRVYPLFQQAYAELGYPNGYFNDRLIDVIDHLLEAPRVEGPVALVQPSVMFKFADPALERSSAGHKLMIRMGVENAERIKAKLREIRAAVIERVDPAAA